MKSNQSLHRRACGIAVRTLGLLILGLPVTSPVMAAFTASSTPLQLYATGSGANIMLIIDNSASMSGTDVSPSRIAAAKSAATNLVNNMNNGIRLGLADYSLQAGCIEYPIKTLVGTVSNSATETTKSTIISGITSLGAGNNILNGTSAGCNQSGTPLARTLADVGKYFAIGTAAPGTSAIVPSPTVAANTTATVSTVFGASATLSDIKNVTYASPIQYNCQKNFAVFLTDGEPNNDGTISTSLANATTYTEPLADVAGALYNMDLRPDMTGIQNLTSYFIGLGSDFAGGTTSTAVTLLNHAAAAGGSGHGYTPQTQADLDAAFNAILNSINARTASTTSMSSNSQYVDSSGNTLLFSASSYNLDSATNTVWGGTLTGSTATLGTNGITTSQSWTTDTAGLIPAPASRKVYFNKHTSTSDTLYLLSLETGLVIPPATLPTYDTTAWTNSNLTCEQKSYLNHGSIVGCPGNVGIGDGLGRFRLNWLLGDRTYEKSNAANTTTVKLRDRKVLLGDIANSNPVYVGKENYGNVSFDSSYSTYMGTKSSITPLVLVGANDGMLHIFNASTGAEVFAFIPNGVFPNLYMLSDPNYSHQYYVDGPIAKSDVKITPPAGSIGWRSVVVGSLGNGGKDVFALDITDFLAAPTTPGNVKILWERSSADSGWGNLGNLMGAPAIARVNHSSQTTEWAAAFGNGYNSTADTAALFVVDIQTGSASNVVDTGVTGDGMSAASLFMAPNVPRVNDYVGGSTSSVTFGDAIYAGDLKGNLWAFKYSGGTWVSKYGSSPLFSSVTSGNVAQPITAPLVIGNAPNGQGAMVFYGTGSYNFTTPDDGASTTTQSVYGIWDAGAALGTATAAQTATTSTTRPSANRNQLIQQTITYRGIPTGLSLEVTQVSNNVASLGSPAVLDANNICTTCYGWFVDLSVSAGERVLAAPLLFNKRILFPTFQPGTDPCNPSGTFRLLEVDPATGGRLGISVFDINHDNLVNDGDFVATLPVSGIRPDPSTNGTTPTVLVDPDRNIHLITEHWQGTQSGSPSLPFTSWRQIFDH